MIRKTFALVALGLLVSTAGYGEVKEVVNFRVFAETFNTPSADTSKDSSYSMLHARLRGGLKFTNDRFSVLALLQGATTAGIPENGAFGIGPVYYGANRLENPGKVSVLGAWAEYQSPAFRVKAGRQRYADGSEAKTGVKYLDWVKKRRLQERLIGNWDWVNVGRRYDGVLAGFGGTKARVDVFGFRPLQGGVNYSDAHEWFENLAVYGGTVTGLYDALIPKSEVRAFYYYYDDSRQGALNAAGGDIKLSTAGLSWLAGDEDQDIFGWFAYQFGDYGMETQEAWALIVETGRKVGASGKFRVGYAQASGDDSDRFDPDPSDDGKHHTFFNMLPTNHKFYGAMDYNAFSNLRTLYVTLNWNFNSQWSGRAALHGFNLSNRKDAWYGGSGAFNNNVLGYAGRRPSSENYMSSKIGQELDLDATWKFHGKHKVSAGGGVFWGDKAAGQVLTVDKSGLWGFMQLTLAL